MLARGQVADRYVCDEDTMDVARGPAGWMTNRHVAADDLASADSQPPVPEPLARLSYCQPARHRQGYEADDVAPLLGLNDPERKLSGERWDSQRSTNGAAPEPARRQASEDLSGHDVDPDEFGLAALAKRDSGR